MKWLWHELTRQRGPTQRTRRERKRGGVALLMSLTLLSLLMVVGTEVTQSASVRMRLAAHQRDEAKAEALAYAGREFYRLILIASKSLGNMSEQFPMAADMGISGDTLWQMVPNLDTGFLRLLFMSGGDADDATELAEDIQADPTKGEELAEQASSRLKKNFLNFDGDFSAEVSDEERRMFVGNFNATTLPELMENPQAQAIFGLMSGRENEDWLRERDLEAWELIANLADWVDADGIRIWRGGDEAEIYRDIEMEDEDDEYRPKNAPFDSLHEIRLVEGWHRDDVWQRFGRRLTIYGSGKININTATDDVLAGLLRAYAPSPTYDVTVVMNQIKEYKALGMANGGGSFSNGQSFYQFLEQVAAGVFDPAIANQITNQSSMMRVVSTGRVGLAEVKMITVFDMSSSRGKIVFWRLE